MSCSAASENTVENEGTEEVDMKLEGNKVRKTNTRRGEENQEAERMMRQEKLNEEEGNSSSVVILCSPEFARACKVLLVEIHSLHSLSM